MRAFVCSLGRARRSLSRGVEVGADMGGGSSGSSGSDSQVVSDSRRPTYSIIEKRLA